MNRNSTIAIFLVLIMLGSVFAALMSGFGNNDNNGNVKSINNVPGTHVAHELNSIVDGLKFSPASTTTAQYADFAKMKQSQMGMLIGDEANRTKIYGTEISKEYAAVDATSFINGSAFRANVIQGDKVNFTYVPSDEAYKGYNLLDRGQGAYTVAGVPMLIGSKTSIQKTIDVLNGEAADCTKFNNLLSKVQPGAELQIVSADQKTVADQYFMELRKLPNGGYTRTSMFINPNQSMMNRINLISQNSSTRGLSYNLSKDGNITKVVVTANNDTNFLRLIYEQ